MKNIVRRRPTIGGVASPGILYAVCPACEEYYCIAQVVVPVAHTIITPHLLFSGDLWEIAYDRCSTLHECVCGAQWEVVLFDKQDRE